MFKKHNIETLPAEKQLDANGTLIPWEGGPKLPYKVPKLFSLNECSTKISDMYFRADIPNLGSTSANILLDTGAEGGNYIASQYAENCGLAIYSDKDGHLVRLANGSIVCLLYTSPSPRDRQKSRMPSSA